MAKKAAKKVTKKASKKSAKKAAPKKAVKKAAPKAAKKVAKKAAPKAAKKAVKKAPKAAPKAAKKVVKKAPKVVKKVTKKAPVPVAPEPVTPAPSIPPAASEGATGETASTPSGETSASSDEPAPTKPTATPVPPAVGSPAPDFDLPSSQGRNISLSDYKGKTVVLYFYPKADTPGCTVEACGFRDAIASYGKLSVDVLGVSPDPIKPVRKFAEKFNLTFPLLADDNHAVTEAYGVWVQKSMYGKTYMGAARTTFIIKDGKVAHVFEKVKPEGHEAEVLKVLETLG